MTSISHKCPQEQKSDRKEFQELFLATSRLLVLANAGGAVATLSFIGTSWGRDSVAQIATIPLIFFVTGIAAVGLAMLGQVWVAWASWQRIDATYTPPAAFARSCATKAGAWAEPRTGLVLLSSGILFVAGAGLGIVALLCLS